MVRDGRTLFEYEGFRFAVFERRGGRWPELGTATEREWMGRFLGRIHMVGRRQRFRHRERIDLDRMGEQSREFLLDNGWIPVAPGNRVRLADARSARRGERNIRDRARRRRSCGCMAIVIAATCCGPTTARTSWTWTIA